MGAVAVVVGLAWEPIACRRGVTVAVVMRTGCVSRSVIVVGGVRVGADHLGKHKRKRNHG